MLSFKWSTGKQKEKEEKAQQSRNEKTVPGIELKIWEDTILKQLLHLYFDEKLLKFFFLCSPWAGSIKQTGKFFRKDDN